MRIYEGIRFRRLRPSLSRAALYAALVCECAFEGSGGERAIRVKLKFNFFL